MLYIHKDVSIKTYGEKNYLYQKNKDEIYEIDFETFEKLKSIMDDGIVSFSIDEETKDFLLKEKILTTNLREKASNLHFGYFKNTSETPLLYLHLIVTCKCNFSCKHCYVLQNPLEAPLDKLKKVAVEFQEMGGLRLLVSGGEPFEYTHFFDFSRFLSNLKAIRKILLTNGWHLSKLTPAEIKKLNFDEIQISIDGLEETHDWLRKKGSFKKALIAAENVKKAGIHLSFATVINSKNAQELPELANLIQKFKPFRWSVDFLCATPKSKKLGLSPGFENARFLNFSFNSGTHFSNKGYACGPNLASLLPDGNLCKCDYFPDISGGNAFDEGLLSSWQKLKKVRLEETECFQCDKADVCRGGCRFRALLYNGSIRGRDPAACIAYGHHEGG